MFSLALQTIPVPPPKPSMAVHNVFPQVQPAMPPAALEADPFMILQGPYLPNFLHALSAAVQYIPVVPELRQFVDPHTQLALFAIVPSVISQTE
jgi:hypothetical protein